MSLDCNHDCVKCPAHLPYGGDPTSCRIINKTLSVLDCQKRAAEQIYKNVLKEGETYTQR